MKNKQTNNKQTLFAKSSSFLLAARSALFFPLSCLNLFLRSFFAFRSFFCSSVSSSDEDELSSNIFSSSSINASNSTQMNPYAYHGQNHPKKMKRLLSNEVELHRFTWNSEWKEKTNKQESNKSKCIPFCPFLALISSSSESSSSVPTSSPERSV